MDPAASPAGRGPHRRRAGAERILQILCGNGARDRRRGHRPQQPHHHRRDKLWLAAGILAEHEVQVVASLPCYSAENVNQQRGHGVFEKEHFGAEETERRRIRHKIAAAPDL